MMRKGFTLIELLVVIGIMGMLGTASTVGYYAAVRGMTDRGTRQDVISFLRNAQQRALMDEAPTAVFFYNELIREADSLGIETEVLRGTAVAVRMAGRISYRRGSVIVDEFADWDKIYPTSGNSSSKTLLRLYRLAPTSENGLGSYSACVSYVNDYVTKVNWLSDVLLTTSESLTRAANKDLATDDFMADDTSHSFPSGHEFNGVQFNGFVPAYGFEVKDGNTSWQVGDAYGFEFATLHLPQGYVFGTSVPSQIGSQDALSPVYFNPATVEPGSSDFSSASISVDLRAYRPGKSGAQSVGSTITANDLKDSNQ